MWHPAVEPTVDVIGHAVAALGENRRMPRQAFAFQVLEQVRLPRGCDPALQHHRQVETVHYW